MTPIRSSISISLVFLYTLAWVVTQPLIHQRWTLGVAKIHKTSRRPTWLLRQAALLAERVLYHVELLPAHREKLTALHVGHPPERLVGPQRVVAHLL
jgi:hypothetical protein